MTAYTIIPTTSIDADSLTDVALMTALRDNPIAIAEGDATAPSITKVALGSTSTAGTQAVGDNSTKIATTAFCEAGFVNNDVGANSVGLPTILYNYSGGAVASNATTAGSNLYGTRSLASTGVWASGVGNMSGTWKNVSGISLADGYVGTFQRIS